MELVEIFNIICKFVESLCDYQLIRIIIMILLHTIGLLLLGKGVLYRVLSEGSGSTLPKINSVVTVHYKGSLVDGRVFDNSFDRGYPEAFRVGELIEGFRMALLSMHEGDKWVVYIPQELGYGKRASGPIPGFSTLVFEIELIKIM